MANNNSNVSTPIVQNIDRPFSELFDLLPQINSQNGDLSHQDLIYAIETHANNASYSLLMGIQSLGVVLATAIEREDVSVSRKDIANLGWLAHGLGNLLEGCISMREKYSNPANL